jgi:hypothetical protein
LLLPNVVPLASAGWTFLRQRRLDTLSGTLLAALVIGATLRLLVNDPRILLVKDSIVTSVVCW